MNTDIFDMSGKVALVTGASRGIGESIARTLASYGAHVIVSSRKLDACDAVAASIREEGGSAEAIACHVGDIAQIDTLFKAIKSKHKKLDVLVNNAATNPVFGHVLDTDQSSYEKTVEVNIRGYLFMSIAAGKLMRTQGGGSIINTASVNGVIPGSGQVIYSMTKAAVISMTKGFAKECGAFNIRVNALLPGLTQTKFASALTDNDDILKSVLKRVPLGRMAQPDEMAGTVLYLASDASSYTTGAELVVDGGYLIGA